MNPKITRAALIAAVEPWSIADAAGISAGEYVHSINGKPAHDYIEWLWESDGPEVELELRAADGDLRTVMLQRDNLQDGWGLVFDDVIYDKIHSCKNDCVFCFMRQLPATARKTLCMRDDDYRLSFLQGNFITLTNLKPEDKDRIVEQRISPLRLSFHASNPEVRTRLMGKNHDLALENFDELIEAGIDFHIQIVLVPGVNDGAILDETLAYLQDPARIAHVLSVGIVPVAYTDYAPARLKEMLTDASTVPAEREEWCKSVIDQVQTYQFAHEKETGLTWVYLADEFYVHAHAPFPLPQYYDGFPQLENGIGMILNFIADVRDNLDELSTALTLLPPQPSGPDGKMLPADAGKEAITIVCGELLTQTWLGVLGGINAGGKLRLLPIKNRFFGGNVSVTGLLTGLDILRGVKLDCEYLHEEGHAGVEKHRYLIPDCIFNDDGITLDDYTAQQLIDELRTCGQGRPVHIAFYQTGVAGLTAQIAAAAQALKDEA
ncbi:MAG: DUF512 domain-containing protein [Coriobacteriia bacterium]|nr:DUF512 domain-containing protein [Coriobacteriia bacterium]MCL2537169.1 DUF512 domain-containing protein [Coriobacteriia bacterium]